MGNITLQSNLQLQNVSAWPHRVSILYNIIIQEVKNRIFDSYEHEKVHLNYPLCRLSIA